MGSPTLNFKLKIKLKQHMIYIIYIMIVLITFFFYYFICTGFELDSNAIHQISSRERFCKTASGTWTDLYWNRFHHVPASNLQSTTSWGNRKCRKLLNDTLMNRQKEMLCDDYSTCNQITGITVLHQLSQKEVNQNNKQRGVSVLPKSS